MSSIFSTYSTGENRVTASFLAVLRSLSLDRIHRLLGALLEQSEFELIQFENQAAKGGQTVPDAIIQSSCRILIETKTVRNGIGLPQLEGHLKRLGEGSEVMKLLLVLTPDHVRPSILDSLQDRRVVWTSFSTIDQAIDEMLDDKYEVVSEREAFLLRQLQNMLLAEGLLESPNDVVVVAARSAWPEYNELHAYICQPERPFQQVGRIGFYSKGVVYPLVPKILSVHDNVVMQKDKYDGELGALVNRLLDERLRAVGNQFKVMLLSSPDAPDTLKLADPIPNDLKSKAGKGTAFTMGQRYVSSKALLAAKTTSDLA